MTATRASRPAGGGSATMLAGGTQAVVACCLCGTSTTTPPFCGDCLKAQADLSAELKPSGELDTLTCVPCCCFMLVPLLLAP